MDTFLDEIKAYVVGEIRSYIESQINAGVEQGIAVLKRSYADPEKKGIILKSPLLRVMRYDEEEHFYTLGMLLKGNLSVGAFKSIFLRLEFNLIFNNDADDPLDDVEMTLISAIGDIKIVKENLFEVAIGFGMGRGEAKYFVGHGLLKLLPPNGFGLDVTGGLSDNGLLMDLGVDMPLPVPLGSTGLGLAGIGGVFAYNFEPKLLNAGVEVANPTAKEYVAWAKSKNIIDLWKPDLKQARARGVGFNADLITLADSGGLLSLRPIGFTMVLPGPIILFGGEGSALMGFMSASGSVVLDLHSTSLAMGLTTQMDIMKESKVKLLSSRGTLESYFSFQDPSVWYMNLGSKKRPISSELIGGVMRSKSYLMMSNQSISYGSKLSVKLDESWWQIKLYLSGGAILESRIGRNPFILEAFIQIWLELIIKIYKLKFSMELRIEAVLDTPQPTRFSFTLFFKIDLPWPLSDYKGKRKITFGDKHPNENPMEILPLLREDNVGLLHELSAKQWQLDPTTPVYPDVVIVLPFSEELYIEDGVAIDVVNRDHSLKRSASGRNYTVSHVIKELSLLDQSGRLVQGLKGIWVHGSGGESDRLARLHLLSDNPYRWMMPHFDLSAISAQREIEIKDQFFGDAPCLESIQPDSTKRFGIFLLKPFDSRGVLRCSPLAQIKSRVLQAKGLSIHFDTQKKIERLKLFLIAKIEVRKELFIRLNGVLLEPKYLRMLDGVYALFVVDVESEAIQGLHLESYKMPYFILQGIRYYQRADIRSGGGCQQQILPSGRYQLTVAGLSRVEGSTPFTNIEKPWKMVKAFEVQSPPTIRSYILESTLGDSRIFGADNQLWNPTLYGYGFPAYREYRPLIRFKVDYMGEIFVDGLEVKIHYEDDNSIDRYPLYFEPDIGALDDHQEAKKQGCTHTVARERISFKKLSAWGAASVELFSANRSISNNRSSLDHWSCYISQFNDFVQHVTPKQIQLRYFYGQEGREMVPVCREIYRGDLLHRVDLRLNREPFSGVWGRIRTREYTHPPKDWYLSRGVEALSLPWSEAFVSFMREIKVRLNHDLNRAPLDGLNQLVEKSVIEPLVDERKRPYALWLRTPEPLDWRRVEATLEIEHLIKDRGCLKKTAKRTRLKLKIQIVPSPDGSSALLVGVFDHQAIMLPSGLYHLKMYFNLHQVSLPKLEHIQSTTIDKEYAKLTFLQPLGEVWAKPDDLLLNRKQLIRYRTEIGELYRLLVRDRDRRLVQDILRLEGMVKKLESLLRMRSKLKAEWAELSSLEYKIAVRIAKRIRSQRYHRLSSKWIKVSKVLAQMGRLHHDLELQIDKL